MYEVPRFGFGPLKVPLLYSVTNTLNKSKQARSMISLFTVPKVCGVTNTLNKSKQAKSMISLFTVPKVCVV